MEIEYNAKADVMYIRFNRKVFHKNAVLSNGLVVADLAEDNTVIGLELVSPSLYIDNLEEFVYRRSESGTSITPDISQTP